MKKFILIIALASTSLFFAQVEKKYNAGLGLCLDPFNNGGTRLGPTLKLDYNISQKFGLGFRGMGVIGTWADYNYSDGAYSSKLDYQKGSDFAFGVDAIYHAVGNNQDSKFGLRVEGGLGFRKWTQKGNSSNNLQPADSLYYTRDFNYGANNIVLKLGIGADYKIGPGKLFLDIPLYSTLYNKAYDRYTNQKVGPGGYVFPDVNYTGTVYFEDVAIFMNIGYQISF